jgi:hypothetical protein
MRLALALALLALVTVAAVPGGTAEPIACVPTNLGGLDYHSEACVDPKNGTCPIYHDRHTDQGVQRTCVGG